MMHAGLTSTTLWLMLLLGAYHGLNPGMGWLFAVALGMQEQKGSAVARSLVPIALGHALAIGSVVLAAAFLGMTLPLAAIRYSVAAILVGLGILLPGAASAPAVGPHAGRLPRPDRLVVSDGLGARRRFDGGAGAAGQQHSRSAGRNGRPQSHGVIRQLRWPECSPPASILLPILQSQGWSPGWSIESSASLFSARRGSTSICSGQLRWWPRVLSLFWYSQASPAGIRGYREKYPVLDRTASPAGFGRITILRKVSSRAGFVG